MTEDEIRRIAREEASKESGGCVWLILAAAVVAIWLHREGWWSLFELLKGVP